MYPTIHSNSNAGVANQYSAHLSHESARPSVNGPSQLSAASNSSNALSVLRVTIADQLSISPAVMTSTETGNIPRTDFSHNFDFEHQVLRDFSTDRQLPTAAARDEPTMLEMQRYTQLGHEQEAVAMALVVVTASEDKDSQVLKFVEDFSNLKAMGFAPEVITGAIIAFPNDIVEATEACIGSS